MRAIGFLVIIALVLAIVYLLLLYMQTRGQARKISHSFWCVSPKTLPSGERQIWLRCEGEEPFLQWDERQLAPSRDSIERQQKFDMGMLDAEAQVSEFNRLRKQQLKALKA